MQPIKITVSSTRAVCSERPDPITTGMVGLRAEFIFSEDWDGLQKTAVCAGSGVAKDILVIQDAITVPPECLTDPASDLKIGLYGTNSTGNIVIPTVYAYCGRLFRGADPSGDTSTDYTLPIWAQLQAMIGDLSNLTTTARDNLVAAINEAAKSGGGGGGTAADVRMQVADGYIQYSTDGGITWRNLIAMKDLIGPSGKSAYTYAVEAGYTGTEAEFSARMAEDIPTVDSTLTKAGQAADAAAVGNRLSTLSEEMLTEESDPTVPSWAKASQKPSYTASEVGADPSGTAASQVSAHNTAEAAHNDIRLLISGLTDRLNALADSDDTTLDQLSEVVEYIKSNRTLIEAITTNKVSVADIIDNLTTNVTNKPLSAAQGVALKALIDGITIPEKLPNPNALTFTGAVTGSYDGSAPVSVEIPGGGGEDELPLIQEYTIEGNETASIVFTGLPNITEFLLEIAWTWQSTAVSGVVRVSFSEPTSGYKHRVGRISNVNTGSNGKIIIKGRPITKNGNIVVLSALTTVARDENESLSVSALKSTSVISVWWADSGKYFPAGTTVRLRGK